MPTKLPGLSDAHHIAIANVASRAAQLDYHIETTVARALAKQPETAEFLLKSLDMNRIVTLLKTLLLDLIPEEKTAITNVIAEITEPRSDRNGILHWTWVGVGGTNETVAAAVSRRPFQEFRHAMRTAEEIQEIANLMQNASHALMEWQQLLHRRVHGT